MTKQCSYEIKNDKYFEIFTVHHNSIFSVILCMAFRIAQGEKAEEILFGIMLGIVLDFMYSIVLLFMNRKPNKTE